jgi:2-succinyl-5-enolpyruvyl-6-hydroxy-3-cyclohexene-1-carboxylate synthase
MIQRLIQVLKEKGYHHGVVCPGARNALIVQALVKSQYFTLWFQPDERSASFFSLGLNQNSSQKSFTVTTSGTAVSECFSAVIEAHYQKSPLLLITADRPKRYSNSGAPQAINQVQIFGQYAHYFGIEDLPSVSIENLENQKLVFENFQRALSLYSEPIHLNFFLEDPKQKQKQKLSESVDERSQASLAEDSTSFFHSQIGLQRQEKDKEQGVDQDQEYKRAHEHEHEHKCDHDHKNDHKKELCLSCLQEKALKLEFNAELDFEENYFSIVNPLIFLGPLSLKSHQEIVQNWVDSLVSSGILDSHFIISEASSNIRYQSTLNHCDTWFFLAIKTGVIQSILKIGGTPTSKIWRDLEDLYPDLPVYTLSSSSYPGLSRFCEKKWPLTLERLNSLKLEKKKILRHQEQDSLKKIQSEISVQSEFSVESDLSQMFFKIDESLSKEKRELFTQWPLSEISWLWRIKESLLRSKTHVYLGNSLTIRNWDFVSSDSVSSVWSNRGANGIDGQVSSFFGWALNHPDKEGFFLGILGDLTTFYDLQAFWFYHQYPERFNDRDIRLVIMNNGGGQIFHKILKEPSLINHHQINFEKIAEMFSIEYKVLESLEDLKNIEDLKGRENLKSIGDLKNTKDLNFERNSDLHEKKKRSYKTDEKKYKEKKGFRIYEIKPSLQEQDSFNQEWMKKVRKIDQEEIQEEQGEEVQEGVGNIGNLNNFDNTSNTSSISSVSDIRSNIDVNSLSGGVMMSNIAMLDNINSLSSRS